MTQINENVQAPWEKSLNQLAEAMAAMAEIVTDILDALVEFYDAFVKIVAPPLKQAIKVIYLCSCRLGFYNFLLPLIGVRSAEWVAFRLPDWIVLRLPTRWVLLL